MAEEEQRFKTRPESTIAQNFAADLDSMFGLDPVVEKLTQTVQEKKQTVSSSEQQLQELEARLRETERRLARVSRQNSPSRPAPASGDGAAAATTTTTTTPAAATASAAKQPHPFAQRPTYPEGRPPTAAADQVPPVAVTPAERQAMAANARQFNAGNDYVMVENGGQAQRGYG